jgi:hypothetical protein
MTGSGAWVGAALILSLIVMLSASAWAQTVNHITGIVLAASAAASPPCSR